MGGSNHLFSEKARGVKTLCAFCICRVYYSTLTQYQIVVPTIFPSIHQKPDTSKKIMKKLFFNNVHYFVDSKLEMLYNFINTNREIQMRNSRKKDAKKMELLTRVLNRQLKEGKKDSNFNRRLDEWCKLHDILGNERPLKNISLTKRA